MCGTSWAVPQRGRALPPAPTSPRRCGAEEPRSSGCLSSLRDSTGGLTCSPSCQLIARDLTTEVLLLEPGLGKHCHGRRGTQRSHRAGRSVGVPASSRASPLGWCFTGSAGARTWHGEGSGASWLDLCCKEVPMSLVFLLAEGLLREVRAGRPGGSLAAPV